MFVELNIDALVGPTHHFGGIGVGNIASAAHQGQSSYPRMAALEGLDKAATVAGLGVPQFVIPPPERPLTDLLTRLGFTGSFSQQCQQARHEAPSALSAAFSSAFMWAANAATFAPGCDAADGLHHLALANLNSSWHRLPEAHQRWPQFEQMFASLGQLALCHRELPPILPLRDEGAANHMRLCDRTGTKGFHLFVYGESHSAAPVTRYLPRQTLAASQAIARLLRLDPEVTFFLQQHPDAIDAGVFHNDVIATSHQDLLIHHEKAFLDADAELARLEACYRRRCGQSLRRIMVTEADLSLEEAVRCYLFNSQLLTPAANAQGVTGEGPRMVLLSAAECARSTPARMVIESWLRDRENPIDEVCYVSLNQSMNNGGGPACLRLRMQLPQQQADRFAPQYRLTNRLLDTLRQVVEQFYPPQIQWQTLDSPEIIAQAAEANARLQAVFAGRS